MCVCVCVCMCMCVYWNCEDVNQKEQAFQMITANVMKLVRKHLQLKKQIFIIKVN